MILKKKNGTYQHCICDRVHVSIIHIIGYTSREYIYLFYIVEHMSMYIIVCESTYYM